MRSLRDALPDGWSIIENDGGWRVLDQEGDTVCTATDVQRIKLLLDIETALAQTHAAWVWAVRSDPAEA